MVPACANWVDRDKLGSDKDKIGRDRGKLCSGRNKIGREGQIGFKKTEQYG